MKTEQNLMQRVTSESVTSDHVACWWLGGSGFVFKTSSGTIIFIDPYLSNCVEAMFGMKRAFGPPIEPEDVRADIVVSTHWHEDHLDPGSIPIIARNNPDAMFIMPPSCMARAMSWGLTRTQIAPLKVGDTVRVKDVILEATPARHEAGVAGWEVPDAVGVLLQFGQFTVYHSGDTEYDVRLRRLKSRKPDVAMLCINGTSGNMDAYEAALLAWHLGASRVIPIHHLLWAKKSENNEETLDPMLFVDTYKRLGGLGCTIVPQIGEEIDFTL